MPNQQGGKNYKKSKHGGEAVVRLEEAGPDELYGRIIKNLGNLNMNVYCNDNVIRMCKVRGSMRKRIWINVGDLVIVSLRCFENEDDKKVMTATERRAVDRGDIVYKVDPSLHSKAKKLNGINPKLFMALESADGKVLGELGARADAEYKDGTGGIEFDYAEEDGNESGGKKNDGEAGEGEDESGSEGEGGAAIVPKKLKAKSRDSKIAVATKNEQDDADLNIDDI
jgi:translation initiation factor 1A